MSMSSSSLLLNTTTWIIHKMLVSKSFMFNPDRNPILKWVFHKTVYSQFCAGENEAQVQKTLSNLHEIGYHGVSLEYAKEVIDGQDEAGVELSAAETIKAWRNGLLQTVAMANSGDFVSLKWSGMGSCALHRLKDGLPPSEEMLDAMNTICDAAEAKDVRLLPSAEPQYAQSSVDRWTTELARKYNSRTPNHAVVYHTYQTYLKSTPQTLSRHLADASASGYTLGVKLVRGAYLETEPPNLLWDSKAETDDAYDGITSELLQRRFGEWLSTRLPDAVHFPRINLMLATHNMRSTDKARSLRNAQDQVSRDACPLVYAQLAGMADEVSCKLIEAQLEVTDSSTDRPKTYKQTPWGSTKECLNYLLRRAAENRDAISRTRTTRRAMAQEMGQRMISVLRRD